MSKQPVVCVLIAGGPAPRRHTACQPQFDGCWTTRMALFSPVFTAAVVETINYVAEMKNVHGFDIS